MRTGNLTMSSDEDVPRLPDGYMAVYDTTPLRPVYEPHPPAGWRRRAEKRVFADLVEWAADVFDVPAEMMTARLWRAVHRTLRHNHRQWHLSFPVASRHGAAYAARVKRRRSR